MKRSFVLLAVLAGLLLFSSACATKKYVRKTVDARLTPVEGRVGELEETSRRTSQELKELDARLSGRIDEVSRAAELAALEAQKAAQQAARVEQQVARVEQEVKQEVKQVAERAENVENYSLARTLTLNFRVGSAQLDATSRAELDSLAAQLGNNKGYVLEIQGFTDATGNPEANRRLSQRRADAVQSYLVEQHNIPLYRVRMIGLGEGKPLAENRTRAGRAQNRRVEVRLLTNNTKSSLGRNGR